MCMGCECVIWDITHVLVWLSNEIIQHGFGMLDEVLNSGVSVRGNINISYVQLLNEANRSSLQLLPKSTVIVHLFHVKFNT